MGRGVCTPRHSPIRYSANIKRLDLSCFLQQISVAPKFNWKCPICETDCCDDTHPVVLDTMVLGILNSLESTTKMTFFEIMADGQICMDPGSESETEDEEPIMEPAEGPR
jgi:hypothetical protein